jgi:hypothetical protein
MTEPILLTVFASQFAVAAMLPSLVLHRFWTDALGVWATALVRPPAGSSASAVDEAGHHDRRRVQRSDAADPAANRSIPRRQDASNAASAAGRRKRMAA